MDDKKLENIIIIVLLLVICCFLFPIVYRTILNSEKGGAKSHVYVIIENVKVLYLNEVADMENEINLPFTVEFNENSYKTYYNNQEVQLKYNLKEEKIQPTSGKITWETGDGISVTNLHYKNYICNKTVNTDITCVKETQKDAKKNSK